MTSPSRTSIFIFPKFFYILTFFVKVATWIDRSYFWSLSDCSLQSPGPVEAQLFNVADTAP